MDYITLKIRKKLTNEPYTLSLTELREMMRQNYWDIEETKNVTESTKRGETYYNDDHPGFEKISDDEMAFFKEVLYRDRKTDGFIMQYPHGTVICQGTHNSYYRGENQSYDSTLPSLSRSLKKLTDDEKKIYRFVADMRIAEFQNFLNKLRIVQFWKENYGTVLYEPLAQHYGIETEWLDVTSDLDVALFFATCKYDNANKKWEPLTKIDTEVSEKTQYGVIFHIPGRQADIMQMIANSMGNYMNNVILPIGYQPFMRCHSQHGYGIFVKNPFSLQDLKFEKLRFRHDEKFSREIFEKMDCGKKIYPQEGLEQFADVIEEIKETTIFSNEAYRIALEKNVDVSESEIQMLLKDCDCKRIFGSDVNIINEYHIKVSRQRIRAYNRKNKSFSIEKKYGIKLVTRRVFDM